MPHKYHLLLLERTYVVLQTVCSYGQLWHDKCILTGNLGEGLWSSNWGQFSEPCQLLLLLNQKLRHAQHQWEQVSTVLQLFPWHWEKNMFAPDFVLSRQQWKCSHLSPSLKPSSAKVQGVQFIENTRGQKWSSLVVLWIEAFIKAASRSQRSFILLFHNFSFINSGRICSYNFETNQEK